MKKRLLFLLMIVTFLASLAGFIFKPFGEEKPKVIVVLKDLNSQYWNIVKAGAEKGFRDFGIDGKVVAPSFESKRDVQEYMLENILKENPDVLIVSPEESSVPVLEKYVQNNIPVLLVDTDDPWKNKTSYIGTNNFDLGRKAGELLGSQLQPGDKVSFTLLDSEITHPVFSERIKGAKYSLKSIGVKIVTEIVRQNEPSSVENTMKTILKKHPDIKGVFATTDIMALSVFDELEEQGYKIPVIGADGIIEMVELVEGGKLSGTVAQNPYDMGYLSAQAAMNVVKGKNVDTIIDTGVDIIIQGNGDERLTFLKKILK